MPRRVTSHVGRRRRSGGTHRRPVPAVIGPAGGRLVLTVALAAGVGVLTTSALASSSSAAGLGSAAVRPAGTQPGADAAPATPMSAAASVTSTTAVTSTASAVPGYVAASNAAVGVPGAAPAIGLAPALQKVRPVPVARAAGAPWVNPLPGAVVSSCFGMRWGRLHAGVDLAAPNGTPIRAAGAGVIVKAGAEAGYGNAVLIDHGNGYLTHYGHMSVITVRVGDEVTAGQQIGDEGSTGHSTGPHLHFEVHKGFYKNPIEPTGWLHEHGVDVPGCGTPGATPARPASGGEASADRTG